MVCPPILPPDPDPDPDTSTALTPQFTSGLNGRCPITFSFGNATDASGWFEPKLLNAASRPNDIQQPIPDINTHMATFWVVRSEYVEARNHPRRVCAGGFGRCVEYRATTSLFISTFLTIYDRSLLAYLGCHDQARHPHPNAQVVSGTSSHSNIDPGCVDPSGKNCPTPRA